MNLKEKMKLKKELDTVIYSHEEMTPSGLTKQRTIIEPSDLKEVLESIIEAIPENEL